MELFKQILDISPFLSALPLVLAVLFQLFYTRFYNVAESRAKPRRTANAAMNAATAGQPNWEVDSRLSEARSALRRQEGISIWNRRTMNALTFSQYIIGGVLASSFVQTQLTKETVGLLGVLVLVASSIHQRYRPDVKYRNAKQRAVQLRALIRKAEDLVYDARLQNKDVSAIQPIRRFVTEGLNQIDTAELDDAQPQDS